MAYAYVIESLIDGTWYTGIALNVQSRLKEHNSGKNRFTKGHKPWKIIYTEEQPDWVSARVREKYLKTAAGKKWLQKRLDENGGISGSPEASSGHGFPPPVVGQAYALQEKVKL